MGSGSGEFGVGGATVTLVGNGSNAARTNAKRRSGRSFGVACTRALATSLSPSTDMHVGRNRVELEARALQRRRQWHEEAALEVAVEAFHLALCFCSYLPPRVRFIFLVEPIGAAIII